MANKARELADAGELTADFVLRIAERGETEAAAAVLAVAAAIPRSAVHRAISLRSAKGIVSLAWKADFAMNDAAALQSLLAKLSPAEMLRAGPGGRFPLASEEMRWQIDFLVKSAD